MGLGPFDPEWADVFFNGRTAQSRQSEPGPPSPRRTVTIDQIMDRALSGRKCIVRYGEKHYKIVVTEVELTGA